MAKSKSNGGNVRTSSMTPQAVGRIQAAVAKKHGGNTPKGSFAARAQRALANKK